MQLKLALHIAVATSAFAGGLAWAPSTYNARLVERQRSMRLSTAISGSLVGSALFASACILEEQGFVPEAVLAFKALAVEAAAGVGGVPAPKPERAYIELRQAHLAADGLAMLSVAAAHLRAALDLDPGAAAAALDFLGCTLQTDAGDLAAAAECFARAGATPSGSEDPEVRFHRAVAADLSGVGFGDFSGVSAAAVESWRYAQAHFPGLHESSGRGLYNGTRAVLASAVAHAGPLLAGDRPTMVLEFGVSFGKSLRMLAELAEEGRGSASSPVTVAGFDTFTGLPEAWGDEPAGTYSTGGRLPPMPAGVKLVQGLFSDTLGPFLKEQRPRHGEIAGPVLALANIDCDLYSATVDIMQALGGAGVVVPGSVLIFDEYFMYDGWQNDEYRAFQEACAQFGWKYKYIAWSLSSKQVAVKITAVKD